MVRVSDHDDELRGTTAGGPHCSRTCAVLIQLCAQLIDAASPSEIGCRSPSQRMKNEHSQEQPEEQSRDPQAKECKAEARSAGGAIREAAGHRDGEEGRRQAGPMNIEIRAQARSYAAPQVQARAERAVPTRQAPGHNTGGSLQDHVCCRRPGAINSTGSIAHRSRTSGSH